ncbi:MAG: hypothetical protein AAFZ65_05770 [Planctomycetota bacterium]
MSRTATIRAAAACLLLTFAALLARLAGVGALLPHAPEEDAYIVRQAALLQAGAEPEDVWDRTVWRKYPHLLAGLLALAPADAPPLPPLTEETLEAHLEAASRPHRRGRTLVALISVLAIPLLWRVACRFTRPTVALWPTALFAASLLPHYLSQQARPHGPVGTFTLACVLAALAWGERPRWSVALGAACASGLALACLHNGLAGLVPLAVAWALAWPRTSTALRLGAVAAIATGIATALAAGYPFLRSAFGDAKALGDETTSGHAVALDGFNGGGFAVVGRAVWNNDPLLGGLACVGLVAGLVGWRAASSERRRAALVCTGFCLPYLAAIGLYDRTFERFALPLWPFLALLAFHGARTLGRPLAPLRPGLQWAPIGLLLAFQLVCVARKAQLDRRPDTYERAAQWIVREVAPDDGRWVVVTRGFLPLPIRERHTPQGDDAWGQLYRIPWREHLLSTPPEAPAYGVELATGRADDDHRGFRRKDGRLSPAMLASVRARLSATGARYAVTLRLAGLGGRSVFEQLMGGWATPLHTASPWGDDPDYAGAGYRDENALRRLFAGERFGPTVRLWELP